jgi:hypothetical protein
MSEPPFGFLAALLPLNGFDNSTNKSKSGASERSGGAHVSRRENAGAKSPHARTFAPRQRGAGEALPVRSSWQR